MVFEFRASWGGIPIPPLQEMNFISDGHAPFSWKLIENWIFGKGFGNSNTLIFLVAIKYG